MSDSYELLVQLTEPSLLNGQRQKVMREFAELNGWVPFDQLDNYPGVEDVACGHVVVEHGLDNSAVITFLKREKPFQRLGEEQRRRLLAISYNNLIDAHFFPDLDGLTYVTNRTYPWKAVRYSKDELPECWRAEAFDQITGKKPNPNVKRLDQALLDTLSKWRKQLAVEITEGGHTVKLEELSTLFNCIILVRAVEDIKRPQQRERILLKNWLAEERRGGLRGCISDCLRQLDAGENPPSFLRMEDLSVFDSLEKETLTRVLSDFYSVTGVPYDYDFSLMSKHALSRIYEHYVSLLRDPTPPKDTGKLKQAVLFSVPEQPIEVPNRAYGSIYTPQYIAKFFAKFLRENHTASRFVSLKTCDPACGSGMFLRTILEMQCDPLQSRGKPNIQETAFQNVLGVDVDPNACQATRLSLSLLYLVLNGRFPEALNVVKEEGVSYFSTHREHVGAFDAVLANPPFTKWNHLPDEWRSVVESYMGEHKAGKVGMYLAMLKVGLELTKPGGYVLYVLPHSFLLDDAASKLRQEIHDNFWVRFLVDLSSVPVFGEVGSYVILLILERKRKYFEDAIDNPSGTVVRCTEFVGQALQSALEGKQVKTPYYEIYKADQRLFGKGRWTILSPDQNCLLQRLQQFDRLDEHLKVRKGFITGANPVFIVDRDFIPSGEEAVYRPYLPDRDMMRYAVPDETTKAIFYPYLGRQPISQQALQAKFPQTWTYLESRRHRLEIRKAVREGALEWWKPERPRPPHLMLRPKIVSPHLVLSPRFSLDSKGIYAVAQCPIIYPRTDDDVQGALKFFVAILNSSVCHWQITVSTTKYQRGYSLLESTTLNPIRVPDPQTVDALTMKRLQVLVAELMDDPTQFDLDAELDLLVASIYGLSRGEREAIGIRD